jgi:iron complex transport system permease protein
LSDTSLLVSRATTAERLARPAPAPRALGVLAALVAGAALLAVLIGRYPAPGLMNPALLWEDPLARSLVLELRVPRVLASLLLGAALGGAGTVLQMLFRNPIVEPGFLGVSQGAALGAATGILLLGATPLAVQGSAAAVALAGLAASYALARRLRMGGWVLRLVLSGITVSALFAAGLGLIKFVADPLSELPAIVFWLLGGLWATSWGDLPHTTPVALAGLALIWTMRWRLNLLSLDEETALTLGAAAGRERAVLLIAAVVPAAVLTALAGMVSWVGLIVPHLARRLVGADARRALPAAILLGAIFVLTCDVLARSLIPGEIPLGIVTSLLGALAFIALMLTGRREVRE